MVSREDSFHLIGMSDTQPEFLNPVADDFSREIPCEAFFNEKWYEARIIRELHLKTGAGKQICRVYLVEFSEHLRFWLSSDLVQQPEADRLELQK